MDIEVILDTAESEAPGLRELARHFLEAEAAHHGMPLDLASVMARRAEGEPELHVTGAADELVRHLAAGPDALGGYSPLMALARVGAPAPVARAESRMRLRPASQSPRQFAEDLVVGVLRQRSCWPVYGGVRRHGEGFQEDLAVSGVVVDIHPVHARVGFVPASLPDPIEEGGPDRVAPCPRPGPSRN